MALMCEPLQASLFLPECISEYILQSEYTMFLPILVTSVSTPISSSSLTTLKYSVLRDMEMVRLWVNLRMLTVVATSTKVARAPPWQVYCIFLCPFVTW